MKAAVAVMKAAVAGMLAAAPLLPALASTPPEAVPLAGAAASAAAAPASRSPSASRAPRVPPVPLARIVPDSCTLGDGAATVEGPAPPRFVWLAYRLRDEGRTIASVRIRDSSGDAAFDERVVKQLSQCRFVLAESSGPYRNFGTVLVLRSRPPLPQDRQQCHVARPEIYHPLAQALGEDGDATVTSTIAADGYISHLEVIVSSSFQRLDIASMLAAYRPCRFTPAPARATSKFVWRLE